MGVPLHMMRWPSSPSPLPSWALMGTSPPLPVYTAATTVTPSAAAASGPSTGTFYGGTEGLLLYGGASFPSAAGGTTFVDSAPGGAYGGAHAPLDFTS